MTKHTWKLAVRRPIDEDPLVYYCQTCRATFETTRYIPRHDCAKYRSTGDSTSYLGPWC